MKKSGSVGKMFTFAKTNKQTSKKLSKYYYLSK